MAARTFRKKNNNKVVSFSALFFMFTLTWITEKELERVIENKGDEFRRKKNIEIQSWAFSDLGAAISAALHETFVRSKYANSVSQCLLYWTRIICCIYKEISFENWRRFCRPSVIDAACEMSPGWGHLITWMDPSVGHLYGIWPRLGGFWTMIFRKVKCPGGCPKAAYHIFTSYDLKESYDMILTLTT